MALGAIIHKAQINLSNMDQHVYGDHGLTIARHPSETDERMMVRLLAFALNVPADDRDRQLVLAKDLWDVEEPALWHQDFTDSLLHWIDVGQSDEKRLLRAAGRAKTVTVYSFSHSTPIWWAALESKINRAHNIQIWQIPTDQSKALERLCARSMQLQITVQDGTVWVSSPSDSVEVTPVALKQFT